MERKELEELIKKEVLEEGVWDRLKAKSRGSVRALQQVGKNLKAAAQGDADNLQNVKFVRASNIAQSRVQSFSNKLNKIGIDFINDMESLFGQNMQNAPNNIRAKIEELEQGFDMFVGDLNDLQEQLSLERFIKEAQKRRKK